MPWGWGVAAWGVSKLFSKGKSAQEELLEKQTAALEQAERDKRIQNETADMRDTLVQTRRSARQRRRSASVAGRRRRASMSTRDSGSMMTMGMGGGRGGYAGQGQGQKSILGG